MLYFPFVQISLTNYRVKPYISFAKIKKYTLITVLFNASR